MKCPKCSTRMIKQDDSFSHEFGTEIIIYALCPKCEHTTSDLSDEDMILLDDEATKDYLSLGNTLTDLDMETDDLI